MKAAALLACLLFLPTPDPAEAQTAGDAKRKVRVAVLDFEYATVQGNVAAIFGRNVDVGKGVSDLLVTNLVKDGTFSVIERKALDQVLAEQNFSNSDRADASTAAKIGKILGVDAILVGSITQFGNDTSSRGVGGIGARIGGIGIGRVEQKQSKAIVGLTARLINVDTAEILAVAEGKGESKRTSASLAGAGATWAGLGGGSVNFGSSDFQNTIIGEAVKEAVDKMSTSVVAGKGRVAARPVVVQGLVAAVVGTQVVLNVGTKAGVRAGDQLAIERNTQEIKDPATGKVIRTITSRVGVVRAVDVDENSTMADIVSGSGFKTGDIVKSAGN